jgi:cytochrome c peroxidase
LITPEASFDQYLRGDDQAISEKSRRGHVLFKSFGCVGCHQGINVSGNIQQRLGIMEPELNWYQGSDDGSHHLGRYNVT